MSGDSDSLQLTESDKIDLDSSDELIVIDSEDDDSDHEGSRTLNTRDATDVLIVESEGCKPGLDFEGAKSSENFKTSTNGLASEGILESKDGSNVEGCATELAASKQLSSESELIVSMTKGSLASSVKDGTDVPSLESQGHKPGLDSGEDKSDEKCMTSNTGLTSAFSLGPEDGSSVEGTAAELGASEQLPLRSNQKESLTISVNDGKEVPSLESKLKLDLGEDKSDQKCVTSNIKLASEVSLESKDKSNVQGKEGNGTATELAAGKQNSSASTDSKVNSEKKQCDESDDAKEKSTSATREKKDEIRTDKENSKKQSQSRDRKGSSYKTGKSNEIPAKQESGTSGTKRNRSGSRHREDEARKRRRVSKSRSRSRHRDHYSSRTRDSFDREREKSQQVSDILQNRIDRLKEEVERARADLKRNSRRSRSRSLDRRGRLHHDLRSNSGMFDERDNSVHYRGRSRSSDRAESMSPLPSVQRFLDASCSDNSEGKQVVVVKKVDVREHKTRFSLLTKFKRYGEVLDSSFDTANKAAVLRYKKLHFAEDAVKNMNNRYFGGEYLKVTLVNERDVELAIAENCSECGKDHSPTECPQLKRRSHSRKRESRARSSSLELNWPAEPRHPSTNLIDPARNLSPLSLLMASESLRNGGIRPVTFRPKPLRDALTKTSADLPLGLERLAKREMMMKKMNSVVNCDWGERSLSDFEVLATVGKGTYGQMYKAADKDRKLLMALKKVTVESDKNGFPVSALQEMKLLSRLDHPNIVKLVEILREEQENSVGAKKRGMFYVVYDYMNHDLKRLLQSKLLQLKSEDIAWFVKQLLSALSYCHCIGLVHRDVRPSNILINNRGELKLAQFGHACLYDEKAEPPESSSITSTEQRMVSLWYRAPELLLGEKKSSPATDIWSCGCVIGEIFSRKPVFLGSDEQHQIEVISKVCGTPSASNWPNVTLLPMHYILKNVEEYPRLFHDAFHYVPYIARNLLDQLLVMDPAKRLTAGSALETDWLKDAEFPKMLPMMLVNINDCHMLMPAKSHIDSDIQSLPGVGKVSAVGLESQKLESFAGSSFAGKTRREDVSDNVAITQSMGGTSVPEADTVWKPLCSSASRETAGVPVAGVQMSWTPDERPYLTSSQPSRRAFNPRVMDYACQPTYAKPTALPEKHVLQPETPYAESLSVLSANAVDHAQVEAEKSLRFESILQRARPPGESMKAHTDRLISSSESRPSALPSGIKPMAQASGDRTLSADLERLRMLKKQLEKRDALATLTKAGGSTENWEVPPSIKSNIGESAVFGVDNLKDATVAGNTQMSFESKDRWENKPILRRTAISGQPPVARTTNLQDKPEANMSLGNTEAGYSSEKQPRLGPKSWPSESSDFGGRWEGDYNKTQNEENSFSSQEPRFGVNWNEGEAANVMDRPAMPPGRAALTYGNQRVNWVHRSEYDDATSYDETSGFSGGWGVRKQPEVRRPFDRNRFMPQMNPGMHGPASAAQAWDEPFSYPENTASQWWEGDQWTAGHNMSMSRGRGFAEHRPYADERWTADDRWNEAPRPPRSGPFRKESDLEWRAPQSRF